VTAELYNWSSTYRFAARRVIDARTIDDVRRAVAEAGSGPHRVRALGTRHSFNGLADNDATLVTVTGIPPDPVIDEDARTVTVGAGITYGALAGWLEQRGWALHNMGSLPHISVGGATATGTHGSGTGNRILSAAIAALDYVAADGEQRHASRTTPGFNGMPVGLGAFGVVVRVTLDIQPSYLVRQDVYTGLPWERVLAGLDDVLSAAYSVSLFTDWAGDTIDQAWVKRRLTQADDTTPAEFFGAHPHPGPIQLAEAPADNLTPTGVAGPWSQRLPHFRIESVPSNGDEIQSEYFVDRRHGAAALTAVRDLAPLVAPLLLVSEIRATAPDDLWLSGSHERQTLAIHFTWRNQPDRVDAALPEVETALAPFDARPHWGKVNHIPAAKLDKLYPRLPDARALFEELDPAGKFSNDYLERIGVRPPR